MPDAKLRVATPDDRTVRATREFDAPPRLVWDAHTKPELVKQWLFGPEAWILETCTIDLRVGGKARYEMRRPRTDETMGWTDIFTDLEASGRQVFTELFDQDWTGGETLVTRIFKPLAAGRTLLDVTIRFSSRAARDAALETGMSTGMEMGYVRLDRLFAGEPAA